MRRPSSMFVATTMLIGFAAVTSGQNSLNYPQWRGQDRDGSASSFTRPKLWPEMLTRMWKVEVGEGYATPLVIGNTVYSFTRRGEDEVPDERI